MTILIEMFDPINKIWVLKIRYYKCKKSLDDFDLYDIPNKRRNATIIE